MRILLALILMISLHVTIAFAQSHREEPDPEPTSFKEAYAGYNEAIKERKVHLAVHYAEKAYEFGAKKFGKDHKGTLNLAVNWINIYNIHSMDHKLPESFLAKKLPIFENTAKDDSGTLVDMYSAYGTYYIQHIKSKNKKKGLKFFDQAIKNATTFYKEDETAIALLKLNTATKIYTSGSNNKARKYLLEAKEAFEKKPDGNAANLALTNFHLAKSYLTSRKTKKAAEAMSLALNTFDEVNPNSQYTMMGHAFMIQILEKQGKRDEATKHCQKIGKAQAFDINAEPIPLYRLSPAYPQAALKKRMDGWVIIEFTIDAEGFATNSKVIDGDNTRAFSKAALDVIKKHRYAPRYEDGQPVATDGVRNQFTFRVAK